MAGFHRTEVLGNLGADPEMRYTANGNAVATFSVAVNEQWTGSDGERQARTEWYSIVTWGRTAENCAQYLSKGDQVFVEGRMQTRSWDGNDGAKHYRTELVAQRVNFLNTKKSGGSGGGTREYGGSEQFDRPNTDEGGDIDPDDLPF